MADPIFGAKPAGIPPYTQGVPPLLQGMPPPPNAPASPPRRAGCGTVAVVLIVVFSLCVTMTGAGAWYYWWSGGRTGGQVGQCFPAGPSGPLDTSQGVVPCSHPNAIWEITRVIEGLHDGDIIRSCGPDGDALVYLPEEDESYCLTYIN